MGPTPTHTLETSEVCKLSSRQGRRVVVIRTWFLRAATRRGHGTTLQDRYTSVAGSVPQSDNSQPSRWQPYRMADSRWRGLWNVRRIARLAHICRVPQGEAECA